MLYKPQSTYAYSHVVSLLYRYRDLFGLTTTHNNPPKAKVEVWLSPRWYLYTHYTIHPQVVFYIAALNTRQVYQRDPCIHDITHPFILRTHHALPHAPIPTCMQAGHHMHHNHNSTTMHGFFLSLQHACVSIVVWLSTAYAPDAWKRRRSLVI